MSEAPKIAHGGCDECSKHSKLLSNVGGRWLCLACAFAALMKQSPRDLRARNQK